MDLDTLQLESAWTLYIHVQSVSTTYSSSYKKVGSFHSIADFWKYFNNIPDVGHIHSDYVTYKGKRVVAYSLFRGNILPEWEKTNNINGSEWGCRENISKETTRHLWLTFALACVGEQIPNCVGLRYINKCNKLRNIHKLELWMNTCQLTKNVSTLNMMRSLGQVKYDAGFPKFTLMRHNDKKFQAIEYTKRKVTESVRSYDNHAL
jgi:hypothetical protein